MFLGSGTGLIDHFVKGNFFLGHLRLGQDQVDRALRADFRQRLRDIVGRGAHARAEAAGQGE